MQATARTVPLAERAAGGSDAGHTERQPSRFCELGFFLKLLPRPSTKPCLPPL